MSTNTHISEKKNTHWIAVQQKKCQGQRTAWLQQKKQRIMQILAVWLWVLHFHSWLINHMHSRHRAFYWHGGKRVISVCVGSALCLCTTQTALVPVIQVQMLVGCNYMRSSIQVQLAASPFILGDGFDRFRHIFWNSLSERGLASHFTDLKYYWKCEKVTGQRVRCKKCMHSTNRKRKFTELSIRMLKKTLGKSIC